MDALAQLVDCSPAIPESFPRTLAQHDADALLRDGHPVGISRSLASAHGAAHARRMAHRASAARHDVGLRRQLPPAGFPHAQVGPLHRNGRRLSAQRETVTLKHGFITDKEVVEQIEKKAAAGEKKWCEVFLRG
jgi:hypothetical protein